MRSVAGLLRGRSEAREAEPVGPVPEAHVRATLPFLSPQVAAMVQVQLLTGARPGEVCGLRPSDLAATRDEVWLYRPSEHKTEHFERERVVMIGPRAQTVLRPWLDRAPDSACFSPSEVVEARNARKRAERRSPMTPSQASRIPRPNPSGRRHMLRRYPYVHEAAPTHAAPPLGQG